MKKIYYLIAMAFVALTFTSCEDVPAPYGQPINPNATVNVDPAGSGTADDPFNIAGAIAKCKEIGDAVSSEKYYVKGYAATAATADAQYGNVSFYLTDSQDGKGKRFYAYQVAGSDGQKLAEGYTINVGDEVVIYGPMYNYNGSTPETASKGAAYIVTVNGEKTNGGGGESGETIGTKEAPISVSEAITMINALDNGGKSTNKAYVKGKVVKVTTNQTNFEKYGNLNYYISEDGNDNNTIQVYSGDGLNGEKFSSITDIAAGDEVIVLGTLYKYVNNNTGAVVPEIDKGNYLVSIVKGSGGGETPTPTGDAYTLTTSVTDGVYAIGTAKEGTTYVLAQALTSGYGYMKTSDATLSDNAVSPVADNNAFTIKATTGGYTIQDADGQYVYMTGTYNSFNRSSDMPSEGAVWTISIATDGAASIKNTSTGKTIQYSAQYTSYGAYTDITNTLPCLFLKGGSSTGGGSGETGSTILDTNFTESQGNWTIKNVTGPAEGLDFIWSQTTQYGMKATAYISSSKTNTESDSWLVSPAFSTTSAATLTFDQAFRYGVGDHSDLHVMISSSYNGGNINASEWTEVTLNEWPTGANWNFITSTASIPAGTKYVAFRYTSTASAAATWEIKTVNIK